MTEDKELRINEVMKMMGLPSEAISLGWYIAYGLLWTIPSLIIAVVCKTTIFTTTNVFMHSNCFIIFLFFWLFGVSVITYCSFLSVFFERAKTASVIGALSFFLL